MESKTSNQDVIREAQKIIFRLSRFTASISPVQIDGIYGPETEAQIRNFQKYIGLPPTGCLLYTSFVNFADCDTVVYTKKYADVFVGHESEMPGVKLFIELSLIHI